MAFHSGSRIFHQFIGMKNIVPDLRAKIDFHFASLNLVAFRIPLLNFKLIQFRFQHLHGAFTVGVLRAFHLTDDHDASWLVCKLDFRFNLVNVLTTSTTRTRSLDLNIGWINIDLYSVVDLRIYEYGSK